MSNTGAPHPVVAKAAYERNIEKLKFFAQMQASYGKWLIVTITSINLAAIYLISRPEVPQSIRGNPWSYWPFVIGICLMLACGLITWVNWTLGTRYFDRTSDPNMLINLAFWPTNPSPREAFWINVSYYFPIFLGLLSAACIIWGAFQTLDTMSSAKIPTAQHALQSK